MPDTEDTFLGDADLEEFIAAALKSDAALTAIVSGRVYNELAPLIDGATGQAPDYPLVMFFQVSDVAGASLNGHTPSHLLTYAAYCIGPSYAQNKAAAKRIHAVLTALDGQTADAAISRPRPGKRFPPMHTALPGGQIVHRRGGFYLYLVQALDS